VDRATRPPQLDRQATDALHDPEEFLALLLRDDLAEQRAEELDLACQGVARAGRADPRRLGTDGRIARRSGPGRARSLIGHAGRLAGSVPQASIRAGAAAQPGRPLWSQRRVGVLGSGVCAAKRAETTTPRITEGPSLFVAFLEGASGASAA
jgi:hypothetical protein